MRQGQMTKWMAVCGTCTSFDDCMEHDRGIPCRDFVNGMHGHAVRLMAQNKIKKEEVRKK